MQCDVLNWKKEVISQCSIEDAFFVDYDKRFINMHFLRMKKSHHVKTNKTKCISEVSGTTKKPHAQKHTGRARQGSLRSPHHVGGSVAFGPRAVQRFVKLPKKEVLLAKKMLLSQYIKNNQFNILDNVGFDSHKTSSAKKILDNFSSANILVIHPEGINPTTFLAVRNMKRIRYATPDMLTVSDLVYANHVLIEFNCVSKFINQL